MLTLNSRRFLWWANVPSLCFFSSSAPVWIKVGTAPFFNRFFSCWKLKDCAILPVYVPSKQSSVKWSSHTTRDLVHTKFLILSFPFFKLSIHCLHRFFSSLDFVGSGIWKNDFLHRPPGSLLQKIAWHLGIVTFYITDCIRREKSLKISKQSTNYSTIVCTSSVSRHCWMYSVYDVTLPRDHELGSCDIVKNGGTHEIDFYGLKLDNMT